MPIVDLFRSLSSLYDDLLLREALVIFLALVFRDGDFGVTNLLRLGLLLFSYKPEIITETIFTKMTSTNNISNSMNLFCT